MKEASMDIEWRTVQFFLEEEYVCEVSLDDENHQKVRCTCSAFSKQARCKHSKYVKEKMEENDGHYSIAIPADISDEEAIIAMTDEKAFREFVLKYAPVLVI